MPGAEQSDLSRQAGAQLVRRLYRRLWCGNVAALRTLMLNGGWDRYWQQRQVLPLVAS